VYHTTHKLQKLRFATYVYISSEYSQIIYKHTLENYLNFTQVPFSLDFVNIMYVQRFVKQLSEKNDISANTQQDYRKKIRKANKRKRLHFASNILIAKEATIS